MKKNNKKINTYSDAESTWIFTSEVYQQICNTIGRRRPEWGGALGSSDGIHIDHYFFDERAERSSGVYSMCVEDLNREIEKWNEQNVRFVGIVHSHPKGVVQPSIPDMETSKKIIEAMDVNSELFIPIIQVSDSLDGTIEIYPYTFKEKVVCLNQPIKIDKTTPEQRERKRLEELATTVPNRFSRIENVLPAAVMEKKSLIVVGCGGSRAFIESMARSGIGKFVLIDGDVYEDVNIATQGAYVSDIGKYKVDVIKNRILDINPLAHVVAVKHFLDNDITDNDFAQVTGIEKKKWSDVLICSCTDSFFANDRCAQLALKYGVPYLKGGIYSLGVGFETPFWYPGLTNSCPRCMLETRYEKVLRFGDSATGSSEGAAVCVTDYLNSIKEYLTLSMLCYNEKKTKYYHELKKYANHNFLMTRCSEQLNAPAFAPLDEMAKKEPDLMFPYVTVAIGQTPEDGCPLCNGSPDYMKGKIADTRVINNPYKNKQEGRN